MSSDLKLIVESLPTALLEKSYLIPSREEVKWIPIFQCTATNPRIGILEGGKWVVEGRIDGLHVLGNPSTYLYVMSLLEQPLDTIFRQLNDIFQIYDVIVDVKSVFPLVEIIRAGFEQGSSYWAELAFRWYDGLNMEQKKLLRGSLEKLSNAKWASQKLRQKAQKEMKLTGNP